MSGSDIGGFVDRAKAAVAAGLTLKPGYSLEWSGQYENMLRVRERPKVGVPITVLGIFMLLFLDLSSEEARSKGLLRSRGDLEEAIAHGAVKRVRPKMMTVAAALLMPIMWSMGSGADVMKRGAVALVGGSPRRSCWSCSSTPRFNCSGRSGRSAPRTHVRERADNEGVG